MLLQTAEVSFALVEAVRQQLVGHFLWLMRLVLGVHRFSESMLLRAWKDFDKRVLLPQLVNLPCLVNRVQFNFKKLGSVSSFVRLCRRRFRCKSYVPKTCFRLKRVGLGHIMV